MSVDRYKKLEPKLIMEEYFNGNIQAWGMFEDTFGIIRKRFTCIIKANFNSEMKTIEVAENFTYDDQSTEKRTWLLKKTSSDQYEATTDSVIGVGKGKTSGNAFHWKYKFELSIFGKKVKVKFDDRMYLISKNVIINRARIYKYGIKLGTVNLYFHKIN